MSNCIILKFTFSLSGSPHLNMHLLYFSAFLGQKFCILYISTLNLCRNQQPLPTATNSLLIQAPSSLAWIMASPRSGIPEPSPAQPWPTVTFLKGIYDCILFNSRNDSPPYKKICRVLLNGISWPTNLSGVILRLLVLLPLITNKSVCLLFSNMPNPLLPQGFCKCFSLFFTPFPKKGARITPHFLPIKKSSSPGGLSLLPLIAAHSISCPSSSLLFPCSF